METHLLGGICIALLTSEMWIPVRACPQCVLVVESLGLQENGRKLSISLQKKKNQTNPTKPLYPITFFWSMWNSLTLRFTGWIDIKWFESVRCQLGFALYQTVPLLLCLEWVAAKNAVLLFRAIVWTWYNPKMLPTQLIMSQDSGMKEFLWASWFIT